MCVYDLHGWTRAWHGAYVGGRGQLIGSLLHLLVKACMSSAFFTHWTTSLPWLLPSLSSLPRNFPLHHQLLSYWSEPAHRPYLPSSPHTSILQRPRPHLASFSLSSSLIHSQVLLSTLLSSSSHRCRIPASGSASGKLIDSTRVTSSVLSQVDLPPTFFYCFSRSLTLREVP